MFMGETSESGNGKARMALSLDRPDSSRPGGPLPLGSLTNIKKAPDRKAGRSAGIISSVIRDLAGNERRALCASGHRHWC